MDSAKADIHLLLVAGVGIAVLAWALRYQSAVSGLVQSATGGYASVVQALQPSGGGTPVSMTDLPAAA